MREMHFGQAERGSMGLGDGIGLENMGERFLQ